MLKPQPIFRFLVTPHRCIAISKRLGIEQRAPSGRAYARVRTTKRDQKQSIEIPRLKAGRQGEQDAARQSQRQTHADRSGKCAYHMCSLYVPAKAEHTDEEPERPVILNWRRQCAYPRGLKSMEIGPSSAPGFGQLMEFSATV
jgi:hypothetical protein